MDTDSSYQLGFLSRTECYLLVVVALLVVSQKEEGTLVVVVRYFNVHIQNKLL